MGALRPVRRMRQRLDRAGVRVVADMKIKAGKYYRTRGGQVFGPMVRDEDYNANFPWCLVFSEPENCWAENGRWHLNGEWPFDLVAEVYVSDTPPDTAPAPEAKTLRDEIAMRLMDRDAFSVGYKDEAEQLYRAADAMMEARKK
jgi:hypothetical protein